MARPAVASGVRSDGFILLCDVVAFSKLTDRQQSVVLEHLGTSAGRLSLHAGLNYGFDWSLNWTGDGFLLVVKSGSPGVDAERVLAGACELLALVEASTDVCYEIRIGVHKGSFFFGLDLRIGEPQVVGEGTNWCARIAGVAGPRQVLVSEEFVDEARRLHGAAVADWFSPPVDGLPLEVPVKHGKSARVRALVRAVGDDSAVATPSGELSPALQVIEQVHLRLMHRELGLLRSIMDFGVLFLSETAGDLTLDALRPRVTIWAPMPGAEPVVLEASRYRVHWSSDAPRPAGGSYRTEPCEGPVARAFLESAACVEVNLPDPASEVNYAAAMEKMGVPADRVARMSRRPRAIVAVPFSFVPGRPSAVLCLDFKAPLKGKKKHLNRLADRLLALYGERLAALWQLRFV